MFYDRWTLHIDKVTADFFREFSSLTSSDLAWKPNADSWSIAQNIYHLMVINNMYFPVISLLQTRQYRQPVLAKIRFVVDQSTTFIMDTVQSDPIHKMKTFAKWRPTHETDYGKILDKLARHQDKLKQLVADSYEFLDKDVVISSPGNKFIVYRLSTAFDIIVAQEKRHFYESIEVFRLLQHKC
jgi:hypothetical protein